MIAMMHHCYDNGASTMKNQQFESKILLKIKNNYRFVIKAFTNEYK